MGFIRQSKHHGLRLLLPIVAALLGTFGYTEAQINKAVNYGIFAAGNLNFHSPTFRVQPLLTLPARIQGDSATAFADNSTSFGFAIGALVNVPINEMFVISGRVGFNSAGATFTTPSVVRNAANPLDSTTSELTFESSLNYLEISPMLQIHNLFDNMPLYFVAGLEAGIPLSSSFTLNEKINGTQTIPAPTVNPATYADNASITDAGVRIALAVGAGWPIELAQRVYLTPEVTFRLPFTQVSSNAKFDSWSVPQLRFGVNLTFGSAPATMTPAVSTLTAGFDGVGHYDGSGTFQPLVQVKVEDVAYSELYPMLPYIFFPQNTGVPSDSVYKLFDPGQKGTFSLNTLTPDAIELNKATLDIIGSRLQEYPNAQLTITGTNDGKAESKNKALAGQRAEYAKQYLQSAYNISGDRIAVKTRDLPEKPSATSLPEGDAENRRLEFSSLTPEILDPILMKSDNKRIAFPDFVEFRPYARSNYPITSWSLQVTQAGRNLREYTGVGDPAPQRWLIRPNELSDKQVPVDYSFSAIDSSGAKSEANGSLSVEYLSSTKKRVENLSDRTIAKFSLVLFDFDKSELTAENARILETLVLPSLQFNSTVKIFGYTDRIGDEEYNKKLSASRALTVKNALEAKVKDAKYETYGLGESVPVFDNTTPIGRHLSRTVQIYVETPK